MVWAPTDLSSSSYGPEEAFRALGDHTYLAVFLAIATALTVSVISYAYSNIIEHFPHGGGGYIVATHMLGPKAGVLSGSALIIDYVLTISVSIASCADALYSFLPMEFHKYKLFTAAVLIIILMLLNIRGVKESILVLAPIFIIFVITHILLLGYGIFSHIGQLKPVAESFHADFTRDLSAIGGLGMFLIFLRAYSFGAGTYTGIEAVSNGLQIMRDPKVQTGKRTMLYMATSLAITAAGLLLCYLLVRIQPLPGKTLNAILADTLFGDWKFGYWIALVTILSEGALLFVAAQTGFIDAPRVMANMAVDSWLPHRFASFSERLTMRNGVLMIGVAALAIVFYTHGSTSALVIMYSINVFITFSLSEFGMTRFFIKHRGVQPRWKRNLSIHMTGLIFCLTILSIIIFEKFTQGGWLTLAVTSLLIMLCYIINSHYSKVKVQLTQLDKILSKMPVTGPMNTSPIDKNNMTAIQLVGSYNGFGVHTLFSIIRSFQGLYKNFVFVSVAVVDQGAFKGEEGLEDLQKSVEDSLKKYVQLARSLGYPAEYRMAVGADVVETATEVVQEVSTRIPQIHRLFRTAFFPSREILITNCFITRPLSPSSGTCSGTA